MSDESNVAQFSPNSKRHKRSEEIFAGLSPAFGITPQLDRNYLVKGWIDKGQTSVLFGPSNGGKSFLALDLAHHIQKGREWDGRRVQAAPVLYLSAEGGSGIRNRLAALDGPEFWYLDMPLTFGAMSHDARFLSEAVNMLADTQGQFGLIIVDTLAKTIGLGDESSNRDMSAYLVEIERIKRLTGAHVMLIHHTGKSANGTRGAYALPAGVDAVFELTQQEKGIVHCEAKKQRDGPKGSLFAYRLRQVELGKDQDGDPVTTCVVEPCEPAGPKAPKMSIGSQAALDALDTAVSEKGVLKTGSGWPSDVAVSEDVWREYCDQIGLTGSEQRSARSMAFKRAKEALIKSGHVKVFQGHVWRAKS